jgi:hypothetical protein
MHLIIKLNAWDIATGGVLLAENSLNVKKFAECWDDTIEKDGSVQISEYKLHILTPSKRN